MSLIVNKIIYKDDTSNNTSSIENNNNTNVLIICNNGNIVFNSSTGIVYLRRNINMGISSIINNTLTHSPLNSNISVIAKGTGATTIQTNSITRMNIPSTGIVNFETIPQSSATPSLTNDLLNGKYFTYTFYLPSVNVPTNDGIMSYVSRYGYYCLFGNLCFFTSFVRLGTCVFPTPGVLQYTLPVACSGSGYEQSLNTGFTGGWSGTFINMTAYIPSVSNAGHYVIRRKTGASNLTTSVMTSASVSSSSWVVVSGIYSII